MRFLILIIGTILAILFIVQQKRGEKFEPLVANLDENEYPLKDLYGVGFAWGESGVLALKGKTAANLKMYASLLYEPQYAEYYANIAWAQMITLAHLILAFAFLASSKKPYK